VKIVDQRPGVEFRKISVPLGSFPGQHDRVIPALRESTKRAITKQIKNFYKGQESELILKCYFLEGYQSYLSQATHDQEYASIALRIEVYNQAGAFLTSCSAQMSLDNKPKKASAFSANRLFKKTIQSTIASCLEKTTSK
jgi:hypothetical protein